MRIIRGAFLVIVVTGLLSSVLTVAYAGDVGNVLTGGAVTEARGVYNPCSLSPPLQDWIPPAYQDLYDALDSKTEEFDTTIASQWNGSYYPVAFSSLLSSATSHRGQELLNPSVYWGVSLQLNRLEALGLKAITVSIGFPLLDSNFTTDPGDFQGYIDFYRTLADDIRSLGLKLIVENGILFPEWTDLPIGPYYQNLTEDEYRKGRLRHIETVAREIQPDFMTIGSEPDTEEMITGQPVATPAAWADQVTFILDGLEAAGIQDIPIGAGVGTWDPDYDSYASNLAATNLSLIDMHIYPINYDLLDRALTIADIAHASGKNVSMTEAWLYKVRDLELILGLSYNEVYARDAWSFFAPLDQAFLRSIVNLSHYEQLEFMSPFWEKYFFAYLDYNDTIGLTWEEIQELSALAAADAMLNNVYSDTGIAYSIAIDVTPPSTPPNLQGDALSETEVSLQWSPSSDNMAVACYFIYRDSVHVSTAFSTSYTDTGLTQGTTYDYEVVAYDRAGNPSDPAQVSVTTKTPNDSPTAAFTYSPANPTVNDLVSFTDLSNDSDGSIVSWMWDFGDSSTSSIQNPTHQYQTNGPKLVTLTVTDDDGASNTTSVTITMLNLAPIADFTYSPITVERSASVYFTDTSTDDGSITSWSWDFGDGDTSTSRNPSHVYDTKGSKTVTLTVTDNDGMSNSTSQTLTVVNQNPNADFTYSPTSITEGDIVQFTDDSSDEDGAIEAWSWDFGDGTFSSEANPTHVYDSAGTFSVTLTVTDDEDATDEITKTIEVTEVVTPPDASCLGLIFVAAILTAITIVVIMLVLVLTRKRSYPPPPE